MTQAAQLASPRRLLVHLLVFIGAVVPWANSQRVASSAAAKSLPTTFTEITSRLQVSLPPIAPPSGAFTLPIQIRAEDYSLEYARRNLVPAMGGSVVIGDFDGDGHPDLYVIVPGGSNHLLQNRADGTFVDVTDRAKVAGSGADLGGAFGDFDKSGRPSLFVAGLGGVLPTSPRKLDSN